MMYLLHKSTFYFVCNAIIFEELLLTLPCVLQLSLKPSMHHYVPGNSQDPNRLLERRKGIQLGLSLPNWIDTCVPTVGVLSAYALMLHFILNWIIPSSKIGNLAYSKSVGRQQIASDVYL